MPARTHRVKRGDTPFNIAQRYCGDGARNAELLDLNPDFRTDETKSGWRMLRTGDVLQIPEDWQNPESERPTDPGPLEPAEVPRGSRFAPEAVKVDATSVYHALVAAWTRIFNDAPTSEALALCVSQWALETGWGKSCFNFNLGNLKAREGDGLDHTFYPTWEVLSRAAAHELAAKAEPRTRPEDGGGPNAVLTSEDPAANTAVVWFYPDHYMCRFRAFRSLDEGAEEYLKALFHRYKRAWASLSTGNPSTFAEALKAYGYFTAPLDGPKGYRTALTSIFNRVQTQLKNAA